jgi:hypothetical protein
LKGLSWKARAPSGFPAGLPADCSAAFAAITAARAASSFAAQHLLYYWPEPQWHGSFLPVFMAFRAIRARPVSRE